MSVGPRRKRGARSILGSLSAYTLAALGAVLVIALIGVTWWLSGGAAPPDVPTARLAATSPWARVSLDDGTSLHVLEPGDEQPLRPGVWRVTRIDSEGKVSTGRLEVTAGAVDVGQVLLAPLTGSGDVQRER